MKIVAVGGLAGPGPHRPFVFLGHVVEHQVEDQADAPAPQLAGKRREVVDGAEVGAHAPVILHRVAAVVFAVAGPEQRQQVKVGHAQPFQILQPLAHAPERAGKAVDVGHVAHHLRLLQPVGAQQPRLVEPFEVGGAGVVGVQHDF